MFNICIAYQTSILSPRSFKIKFKHEKLIKMIRIIGCSCKQHLHLLKHSSHLVRSELANDGLVQEEADIFQQVEGSRRCRALVDLLFVFGFMRIDSFQYA